MGSTFVDESAASTALTRPPPRRLNPGRAGRARSPVTGSPPRGARAGVARARPTAPTSQSPLSRAACSKAGQLSEEGGPPAPDGFNTSTYQTGFGFAWGGSRLGRQPRRGVRCEDVLMLPPRAPPHESLYTLPCVTPPPPSRTKWTRLVHPSVLIGHVSSLTRPKNKLSAARRLRGARGCSRARTDLEGRGERERAVGSGGSGIVEHCGESVGMTGAQGRGEN